MTLAKHNYHTAAALPPSLTPEDIIAALHDHNTCLTLQALTTGHTKLPSTSAEVQKDTWWYPPDLNPITTYHVTETIQWLPGVQWGRYAFTFPTCFQNTRHGLKTRADASGVLLRAEFRVIRGSMSEGEVDGEGEGLGEVEWVLVEDVEVQCSWWMMPFVRGKMEGAHRDICRKVVEMVVMGKQQEAVARMVGRAGTGETPMTPVTPVTPLREAETGGEAVRSEPKKIVYG
ncbi:hypothetical protein K458DRAFT_419134 [Lentithecium fluviatile CBS 122367]|uniref:DUF7053 domain-containing protein n=1 Tax=Lentithecium fluviatile CBS 122367 TaxID=1168545 RepID=A0A6G1IXB4_9PLEO|nr:hypothetical protein K458DRAFT_419134 [Lentithecium fluviatile CBS 122367]